MRLVGRMGCSGPSALFVYGQRALEERPRPARFALSLEAGAEVVEARCRMVMLGAERLFVYRQRALEERPRPRKVALVAWSRTSEVVEARRRVGMLGAEHLFAYRQRALKSGRAPAKSPWSAKQAGEVVEALPPYQDARGRAPFSRIASARSRAAAPPQSRLGR